MGTVNTQGMRRRVGLAAALLGTLMFWSAATATAQGPCIGDCNSNKQVTIEELLRGVNIALGAQGVDACTAFDRNENELVTIDELVAGVRSALDGCFPPVVFSGTCLRPAPGGLVPCGAGSAVRISLCLDRGRCLFDPGARRLLESAVTDAQGRFFLFATDEALLRSLLILESEVAGGVVYRTFAFGPETSGSTVGNLALDPRSEAVVRLIGQNGLDRFTDLGISELIGIIRAALANLTFAGIDAGAAADLATSTAGQDATVITAIESRQSTPIPTSTVTLTPTLAPTATTTRTSTVTSTFTPTATATQTRTNTNTPSATATPSASSTPTLTVTATATPSVTRTPTITATPTNTLPPLNLAIAVNPDPVRPGETVEVSYTITNTGGSAIGPVSLQSTLPTSITSFLDNLNSGTGRCGPNQINSCEPGGTVSWNFVGSLDPGEGITLRLPPIIAPGTPNGTEVTFSGTASVPGMTATSSYSAVVQSAIAYPYDLTLHPESDPVLPGSLLTYTLTYGFRAVVGQADTRLSVAPPAGTTFVSASDGGTLTSGTVEWSLGTLTPGDGGVRRFTVQVPENAPLGALLATQAVIRKADDSGAKRANAVDRVQGSLPIGVTMQANPDPSRPGDSVEVAIHLTNPSATGRSVTLDLVVPDQVDTFSDATTMGGGICGPFTLGNPCERRSRVRFPVNVPPRDGVTLRADPFVSMGAPNGAVINLQAHLINQQGSTIVTARRAVRVDGGTIWDLRLDADRHPVAVSDIYTYHLTARHRPSDPNPAAALLSLELPAAATVVDAGDGVIVDGTVQWDLGALPVNAVISRAVRVQVANGTAPGSLLEAAATIGDPANPLASARQRIFTRVAQGTPLALSWAVVPDPVRPGEVLETQLTVTNTGTNATSARVEARLPDGTDAFAASLSNAANCSATTLQCAPREIVRWTMPLIQPGSSATVRMPPIVSSGTANGTLLRLIARAGDLGGAPTDGRDSVLSRSIVVDGATPFDLELTESTDPIIGGQTMEYTLHYGRRAATPATAAVLRLQLPPGVFFVGSDDGGMQMGEDVVEWDLGALAAGETGSRTAQVVVDALLDGTPLRPRATISDGDDPATEKRAQAVTTVGAPALVYAVDVAPDSVAPGGSVVVSLSITNPRASAVSNVSVEGIVPFESPGFLDNTTTGDGRCGPFTFNTCAPLTRVGWNVPTVGAGQTATVTMTVPIRANVAAGTVVRFVGRFQENLSTPAQILGAAATVE